MVTRDTPAHKLCAEWGVQVEQPLFGKRGEWYGRLTRFPAALVDPNGYLYLESPESLNIPGIKIGKQINVQKGGISGLPGYVRMTGDAVERVVYQRDFDEELKKSKKLAKEARMNRICNAEKNPVKVRVVQTMYKRSPDVVAEVLERAAGICEACERPAPFNRKIDNSPYLEVHHLTALSEGGEDTLENTIAVCPNCHRRYHYGKLDNE